MPDQTRFRIQQGGLTVCATSGPDAEAEVLHYAMQYRQDGELTIQHNAKGHWTRHMLMAQWPIPEARHD